MSELLGHAHYEQGVRMRWVVRSLMGDYLECVHAYRSARRDFEPVRSTMRRSRKINGETPLISCPRIVMRVLV